jgi:hypothetical protein
VSPARNRSMLDPLEDIRPGSQWAAVAVAQFHKRDAEQANVGWSCKCRCCTWARPDFVLATRPKGAAGAD